MSQLDLNFVVGHLIRVPVQIISDTVMISIPTNIILKICSFSSVVRSVGVSELYRTCSSRLFVRHSSHNMKIPIFCLGLLADMEGVMQEDPNDPNGRHAQEHDNGRKQYDAQELENGVMHNCMCYDDLE